MTTTQFSHAGFLDVLEHLDGSVRMDASMPLSPFFARMPLTSDETGLRTKVADALIQLLKARRASLQAAFDTELAADELRRYQKYAKPGKPSAHIVQLRQKQAAARQALSVSRQSLIKAAAAFVRDAGIDVPERVALDVFIIGWIDANVPRDAARAT
ncbi:hypothetical protein [Dyella sp. RRB7]|uniref:hypothetical protein n=1 Tax=Dyella sp. RRB7 TaxID=2919502 RepID=UPI001FAA5542|nr:hypothetical protein [Dyella sp. RRB7]